jgi:opacity protein-like surface antigen
VGLQHDYVAGIQYAPWQNVKLIGEYRYRVFEDRAVGNLTAFTGGCGILTCQPYVNRSSTASIVDNGFTARLMMGF